LPIISELIEDAKYRLCVRSQNSHYSLWVASSYS